MDNEERDIEIIERYLNAELDNEATSKVEERLLSDKEFHKLKDDYLLIKIGTAYGKREELRESLVALEKTLDQNIVAKKSIFLRAGFQWAVAASVVLLFGLFFMFKLSSGTTNSEIFAAYFEPYPNVVEAVVRADTPQLTLEQSAYYNYEAENYKEAIDIFLQFPDLDSDDFAKLYLGVSLMANNQSVEAIDILQQAQKEGATTEIQAKWYLALAHLTIGEVNTTKEILSELTTISKAYKEKAEELLKKLDKIP